MLPFHIVHLYSTYLFTTWSRMPRSTRLSTSEQAQIDVMRDLQWSIRQMSLKLNRSRDCIARYVRDPLAYNAKKSTGRPKKLNDRDRRSILRLASNTAKTANEMKEELGLRVSKSTIIRVINESPHIVREKMKKATRLTQGHKDARLRFARTNMQTDWKTVVLPSTLSQLDPGSIYLVVNVPDHFFRQEVQLRRTRRMAFILERSTQRTHQFFKEEFRWGKRGVLGRL